MVNNSDNAYKQYIEECIQYINNKLHISYDKDLIIDFTAKNGLFIDKVDFLCKISLMYDKDPIHPDVKQLDFHTLNFDKFNKTFLSGLWFDDIHIIGCPPNDEVEECIDTACNFAHSVSFILPKTKKTYIFPLSYKCLLDINLDSSTIFQIWIKSDC
jgi:hypothetical protein